MVATAPFAPSASEILLTLSGSRIALEMPAFQVVKHQYQHQPSIGEAVAVHMKTKSRYPDEMLVGRQQRGTDQPEQSQEEIHTVIVSVHARIDNGGFLLAGEGPRS